MENKLSMAGDVRPVPDPTLLTTMALTREVAALKELLEARIEALGKAQALFETNLTRLPTEVDKQIGQLKELGIIYMTTSKHPTSVS